MALLTRMTNNPHNSSLRYPLIIRPQTFIPKLIMLFVVVFVFEETIYGQLSFGPVPYLIAKTWTEAFLYLFLLLVILHQLVQGRLWRYQPTFIDVCIVAFIIIAMVSTIINHGGLMQGILNIRTMLRYMAIYYIIVVSGWIPTERQLVL